MGAFLMYERIEQTGAKAGCGLCTCGSGDSFCCCLSSMVAGYERSADNYTGALFRNPQCALSWRAWRFSRIDWPTPCPSRNSDDVDGSIGTKRRVLRRSRNRGLSHPAIGEESV